MDKSYQSFREKLEEQHDWPDEYMFKFIVPEGKEEALKMLLPGLDFETKKSSGGKYVSFTATVLINSTDEVIHIYEEANKVAGVIAL